MSDKQKAAARPRAAPEMSGVRCTNPECDAAVPPHSRHCVACSRDAGFPNVRAAESLAEREVLAVRVEAAYADANVRACRTVLDRFRASVNQSKAVIARSVGLVKELASSDSALYSTFYHLVESRSRLPEDNEWDRGRESVDSLLFPQYHKEIRFAALSLNEQGVSGYGGLNMVLKDGAIRDRATVFEKNTVAFCLEKHVVAGGVVPHGYRASWKERGDLAVAKLYGDIDADTHDDAFADILMPSTRARTSDFIEVHVYGDLHRRSITKVTGREPKERADKILLRSVRAALEPLGISVEIQP